MVEVRLGYGRSTVVVRWGYGRSTVGVRWGYARVAAGEESEEIVRHSMDNEGIRKLRRDDIENMVVEVTRAVGVRWDAALIIEHYGSVR